MWKAKSKTKEPDNRDKAYEYAVFLLSLQLRTVGEIREKMQGRGYSSVIIEQTIDQLHQQKYLDDERYAEVYLDNLKQYKNLGYYGIKRKFMAKKLSSEVIEKTLTDGLSVEDELKIAKRFLKKEHLHGVVLRSAQGEESLNADNEDNSYSTYNSEQSKDKQKLSAKLKSRGFRGEVIAKLIR